MAKWFGFKERKRRFVEPTEAPASVENGHIAHFEFGMVKTAIWNFPKADGYSIGIGTFQGGEGQDFKSILSEYAAVCVDVRTKQYGHPLSGMVIKAAYPKCDFGWRSCLCS